MTTKPKADSENQAIEREMQSLRAAWAGRAQVEPPDLLDQAVLNAARRELASTTKHRPLKWLGAAATAVVVVLALAIVVQQQEQAPLPGLPESDGFRLQQSTTAPAATDDALNSSSRPQAPAGAISQEPEASRTTPQARAAAATAVSADRPDNEARPRTAPATEQTPQDRDATMEDSAEVLAKGVEKTDPEAWIERLLLLRREGREDELRVELAAFRKAWPDHPLPSGLGD